jgi:hypothetical protein
VHAGLHGGVADVFDHREVGLRGAVTADGDGGFGMGAGFCGLPARNGLSGAEHAQVAFGVGKHGLGLKLAILERVLNGAEQAGPPDELASEQHALRQGGCRLLKQLLKRAHLVGRHGDTPGFGKQGR